MQLGRIAAAQSTSRACDLVANVATHCRFIAAAAEVGVELLVFPELSLCGYVLPSLASCIVAPDAALLAPIVALAAKNDMTVIVGCPVAGVHGKPHIGAIVCMPDGRTAVYAKQHLHAGETQFAVPCEGLALRYPFGELGFALAICADTAHASHAQAAAANGTLLYLASVLVSDGGYVNDAANLQGYAKQHAMGVLMANHGGPSGPYVSAGKSTFWKPDGELLVQAPGTGNCLVIASCKEGRWSGECVAVVIQ